MITALSFQIHNEGPGLRLGRVQSSFWACLGVEEAACILSNNALWLCTHCPEGFLLVLHYLPSDSLDSINVSEVHTVSTDGRSKGWTKK